MLWYVEHTMTKFSNFFFFFASNEVSACSGCVCECLWNITATRLVLGGGGWRAILMYCSKHYVCRKVALSWKVWTLQLLKNWIIPTLFKLQDWFRYQKKQNFVFNIAMVSFFIFEFLKSFTFSGFSVFRKKMHTFKKNFITRKPKWIRKNSF